MKSSDQTALARFDQNAVFTSSAIIIYCSDSGFGSEGLYEESCTYSSEKQMHSERCKAYATRMQLSILVAWHRIWPQLSCIRMTPMHTFAELNLNWTEEGKYGSKVFHPEELKTETAKKRAKTDLNTNK